MELVYLWVKEYKNIKNQGFDFSPRFKCKFDGENLTITENKDYVSIFPDNINVTAIVGKNGAGKSTIQKLIFLLIFLKKYENFTADNPIDEKKTEAIIEIFKNDIFKDKNIFLIVNTAKGLKKISLLQSIQNYDNPTINTFKSNTKTCPLQQAQYTELKPDEIDFFSIHFHYMIDSWFDGYHTADDWTLNLYHRVDGFETPLLLEPYKGYNKDEQYINITNIEYLNNQHMFDFYAKNSKDLKFNSFFNPKKISLLIDANKIIRKYYAFYDFNQNIKYLEEFQNFIYEKIQNKDLITLNKLYLIIKIIDSKKEIFTDKDIVEKTTRRFENIKNIKKFQEKLNEFDINDLLSQSGFNETKKLEVCVKFHKIMQDKTKLEKYEEFLISDPSNPKRINLVDVYKIFELPLPWVEMKFYDNNKSYSYLSSGEKAFLNFAMNLLYQIENIKRNKGYKTINLFLDEVEYSMHPEWQRDFLHQVLFLLKNFKELNFNLIFVTHSPFLLSDLPKENVIFLEKYDEENKKELENKYPKLKIDNLKNGNCINVSEHIELKTFGANIHTLLSNGFFMSDGLMGEFAKNKITEILEYLNDTKNEVKLKTIDDKQIKPIIDSIGEEFLRNKLLNLYYKKFTTDKKEREKLILKKKINELQKLHDELDK